MESENQSAKIRNYAIAGLCIVFTILILAFFVKAYVFQFGETSARIYSNCENESANVFIGANKDLKNVKCLALDKELFINPEIIIGDLSKNSEDVCIFELTQGASKPSKKPLRFEIWYNGKAEREVCEWQHYPMYG